MTIGEMNKRLSEVDDISWGMYAFSRDVLCHRIGDEKKRDMIQKAVECGNQLAERTALRFGTTDPWQIARSLGLSITFPKEANVGGRILFALFTPPNQIQIMREPIQKAASDEQVRRLVTEDQMKNLILGHELFHFFEEEEEKIYTRTETITLWKFFGYRHTSTIRALSEIAGMAFTKNLNQFPYSPFTLDILLYYNYNSSEASAIYAEVMQQYEESRLSMKDE